MKIVALTALALAAALVPQQTSALPEPNPWIMDGPVMNISHQGGENEAPSNTMYAFESSLPKGADVLELDVHATKDGHLVVLHDATVDRTTNGTGRVDQLTLAQIQQLDAAYWFVPDVGTTHSAPASAYVFRGVATGQVQPPSGYEASDFRIPTLRAVLEQFGDSTERPPVPINIEIKNTAPDTTPYEAALAGLLDELKRVDDVIVVSFLDHATELFKAFAPDVHTATATVETALFKFSSGFGGGAPTGAPPGAPNPRYVALQVPITFNGIEVVTQDFIDDAHANGLAVHVWTINDRPTMEALIDMGVDGIMTDVPTLLQQVLEEKGVAI